jgi:hypothetical protein
VGFCGRKLMMGICARRKKISNVCPFAEGEGLPLRRARVWAVGLMWWYKSDGDSNRVGFRKLMGLGYYAAMNLWGTYVTKSLAI